MTNTTTPVGKMKKVELETLVLEMRDNEAKRLDAERIAAEEKAKGWTPKQRVAVLLGGVAALLVALSVYHLTCGIATLTGSPIALALLLAIGIDIGLVASEVAEVLAHGDNEVKKWSRVYMAMATVMSMLLNAYEFAAHSPDHWFSKTLSVCFGLVLPVMVWVLARQGMKLWGQSK